MLKFIRFVKPFLIKCKNYYLYLTWSFQFNKVDFKEHGCNTGRCVECDAGSFNQRKPHLSHCYDDPYYCPCTYEQQLKLKSKFQLTLEIILIIEITLLIDLILAICIL